MKQQIQQLLPLALLVSGLVASGVTWADTAANTVISNTVTVNYDDANGNAQPQETASVDLTVNLVAAAPQISTPADIDPATENSTQTLNYDVTATSNGPDTYNLNASSTDSNVSAPTFTSPTVTLGGTTIVNSVTAGDTNITVPFDDTSDGVVNDISSGDTIVLAPGGTKEVATVSGISENPGSNTATITVSSGLSNGFAVGDIIGQRQTVGVDITTGTISSGASGTHDVITNAESQTDNAQNTDSGTTTVTVRRPDLTVNKYVRNVTNANAGSGSITVNGNTYYASGVDGDPGDTMEYLVEVDNTNTNASQADNVVINDPIPKYTSYVGGSMKLDAATTSATGSGSFTALTDTLDDGDAGERDTGGDVYIYAGSGGDDSAAGAGNGTGGTLSQGEYSFGVFQVTID